MKIKISIMIIMLLPFAWSCSKENIPLFESNVAGVYFQTVSSWIVGGAENYVDSVSVSFSGVSGSYTSISRTIEIKTMGKQVDYDRPVRVIVDPERTTATKGVHFEVDTDTVRVKANQSTANISLQIIRTADMTENIFDIAFKLEDNEYFKCHLSEYKNTSSYTATGKQISGNKFIISVSELYSAPRYWTNTAYLYFGTWSPLKYMIVNSICDWIPSDWNYAGFTGYKIQLGRLPFAATQVQKYLQEMADNSTPVKDNDGSYMILGEDYPIDYSKYQ